MRFFICAFLAFGLVSCGETEKDKKKDEPNQPFSEASWEDNLRAAGRLERSLMTATNDIEDETLSAIKAEMIDRCAIQDEFHGRESSPFRRTLKVSGTDCPIFAAAERSEDNGELKLRASLRLINPGLQSQNKILNVSLNGRGRRTAVTGGTQLIFDSNASIAFIDNSGIRLHARSDFRKYNGKNGTSFIQGSRLLRFSTGSSAYELKFNRKGDQKTASLNGQPISLEEYERITSLMGPLLAGLIGEASL